MSADIGRLQVGQPPAPVKPAPVPAGPQPVPSPAIPVPPPGAPPPITIPPTPSGGGKGRTLLFIVLGVLGIGILAVLASALLGGGEEIAQSPTPTPSPSATLSPREKTLSSYFGVPKGTVTLADGAADFQNALLTAQPAPKQALVLEVRGASGPMAADAFFAATMGQIPADITAALGGDWAAMAYGQTELFNADGTAIADPPLATRAILAFELSDASKANQAMQAWEGTDLDIAAQAALGYDQSRALVEGFASGTYRNIPVRYRNFPYADTSIDWAVILASNGKNYLLISASRESMFFAIDQLMQ